MILFSMWGASMGELMSKQYITTADERCISEGHQSLSSSQDYLAINLFEVDGVRSLALYRAETVGYLVRANEYAVNKTVPPSLCCPPSCTYTTFSSATLPPPSIYIHISHCSRFQGPLGPWNNRNDKMTFALRKTEGSPKLLPVQLCGS
jgi:hypothetical protein